MKNTPLSRAWFKQDDEFLLPKAIFYVEIFRYKLCCVSRASVVLNLLVMSQYSPLAYLDPLRCSQVCLLTSLFHDALNEFTYAAEVAGLGYSLQSTKYGLQVSQLIEFYYGERMT